MREEGLFETVKDHYASKGFMPTLSLSLPVPSLQRKQTKVLQEHVHIFNAVLLSTFDLRLDELLYHKT